MNLQRQVEQERYTRTFSGWGDEGAVRMESVDRDKHIADFIIATETPVRDSLYLPPTSLQMDGAVFKYYNGVVLAQHDHDPLKVIGRSLRIWKDEVDGKKVIISRAEFDVEDEFSERVWGKVDRGYVRSSSISFKVINARNVDKGMTDRGTGLKGPVRLATQWQVIEWSVVAVGADPNALGRSDEEDNAADDEIKIGSFYLPPLKNSFRL